MKNRFLSLILFLCESIWKRNWYIVMLNQISINRLIIYWFFWTFFWTAFAQNSNTHMREIKLMWRNWRDYVKKFSYFRVSSTLKMLKCMWNHCETDYAKSWKKWFHENDHTNYSNHIETKNAIKWLMQQNLFFYFIHRYDIDQGSIHAETCYLRDIQKKKTLKFCDFKIKKLFSVPLLNIVLRVSKPVFSNVSLIELNFGQFELGQ